MGVAAGRALLPLTGQAGFGFAEDLDEAGFFFGAEVVGEMVGVMAGEGIVKEACDFLVQEIGQGVEGWGIDEVAAAVFEEAAAEVQGFE
jgi:hypothetical protein